MKMMNRGRSINIRKPKTTTPTIPGLACNYPHRTCMRNRLEGYEFCCKHILEDKTAPFRQCNYVYPKNGRRCTNVTSKLEKKDNYCSDHSRKSALLKQNALRKKKPAESVASLLDDLDHYNLLTECRSSTDELSSEFNASLLSRLPLTVPVNKINKIIDYASDTDSEDEVLTVDQTYKGVVESDAESVDSENEDVLKHAGVYTLEEVAVNTREKLIRLQSLYIEQFKRLQHVLKEKRRKYLHAVKFENETFGNSNAFVKSTPKEACHYKKLKALLNYHKLNGMEIVMHLKSKERRKCQAQGANYVPPHFPKCFHNAKNGEKCSSRALPLSRYCATHILEDNKQVLYRPCAFQQYQCNNPVSYGINMATCILHSELPPLTSLDLPPPPIKPEDEKMEEKVSETGVLEDNNSLATSAENIANTNSDKPDSEVFATPTQLWEPAESKLRQVLESIDMTPGELPPEELLDTS